MTKILVTGGNGFIGSHLVSALVARGRDVRVLDVQPTSRALRQVEYVRGSVLDSELMHRAMDGVHEVYHLAGLPGMWMPRRSDFHAVNCGGTEIVLEKARKRGVKRFLHCSTESILFRALRADDSPAEHAVPLDDMPGPYTRSKMLAERFAMQAAASGFPVVIGCPTMPIGPHDHNITPPTAMLQYFLDRRLQFYMNFIVNLVDVRDVAAGLILAMERGKFGHRYVLGGESIQLKQILQLMTQISGCRSRRIGVPGRIAETAGAVMEFIADHVTRRPPSGTAEGVRIALRARHLSIEKAQCELGYAPGPVEPILRETIAQLLASARSRPDCTTPGPLARLSNTSRRFGF
jgi:dihydroflavonol-4-reductase